MPVWTTKHSAADIKAEAKRLGLGWRALEGVQLHRFDDGSSILVTADTTAASKLVERLVAAGMVETGH